MTDPFYAVERNPRAIGGRRCSRLRILSVTMQLAVLGEEHARMAIRDGAGDDPDLS